MSKEITADELMSKESDIWHKHGWKHSGDVAKNYSTYMKEVKELIKDRGRISQEVLDELTANNWHNLRGAIENLQ